MMLFISSNYLYAYILALIFGVYMGISETVQRAVIPKYVTAGLTGTAHGIYNLVSGVCFFASNITFGYIWDTYNLNLAIFYSLFFSFCAIGGMSIFIKKYSISSGQLPSQI
jgi:MFS-type transporter involved in bile tolerance (Atg22 family)